MLKCSDCGTDLPEDAKFCLNGGDTEVAKIQKEMSTKFQLKDLSARSGE